MFLRLGVALSKLRCTVEKTSGTVTSAGGRERPQRLFGRLKAEKVGSLPPDLVFFPRRLFLPAFRISGSEKKLLAPQTEEGAEEEAEGCSFCLLQVSSSDLLAGTALRLSAQGPKSVIAAIVKSCAARRADTQRNSAREPRLLRPLCGQTRPVQCSYRRYAARVSAAIAPMCSGLAKPDTSWLG